MMKLYRSKPTTVEAVQWIVKRTPSDDAKPIVDFINANGGEALFIYDWLENEGTHFPHIMITTLEGKFAAKPGDYICRGFRGEFWPVKSDVFLHTNEPVNDEVTVEDAKNMDPITLKEHD